MKLSAKTGVALTITALSFVSPRLGWRAVCLISVRNQRAVLVGSP